ncbi:hypothetical protein [Microtetraspora malaysiensis]|uniref:Uncharacterized protein n=1 Tax=Microtetraspora malaysiensis TaxID=161358 RepID=A0ABW6SV16_9ACTN
MAEPADAMAKLHAELAALGVSDAYEIGDGVTLSVWIGLVVSYRDGFYRWQEASVKRRHVGSDPSGCAIRVARRYADLRANVPPWWEDLARVIRGDKARGYP